MSVAVIKHRMQEGMYWQRGKGWGDARDATEFDVNDMHKLPLPPHGEWKRLDNVPIVGNNCA